MLRLSFDDSFFPVDPLAQSEPISFSCNALYVTAETQNDGSDIALNNSLSFPVMSKP